MEGSVLRQDVGRFFKWVNPESAASYMTSESGGQSQNRLGPAFGYGPTYRQSRNPYYKRGGGRGGQRGSPYGMGDIPKPRSLAKQELKFHDKLVPLTLLTDDWSTARVDPGVGIESLCGVPSGDGEREHTGRCYWIHSLHINGTVVADYLGAEFGDSKWRWIVVLDTQTNGVAAAGDEVMSNIPFGGIQNVQAFRNLQETGRFQVLKDKVQVLKTTAVAGNSATPAPIVARQFSMSSFKANIKFKNPIKVRTTGPLVDVSDIADNSFHLYAVQREPVGGPPFHISTSINYVTRCRFTEG